MMSYDEMDIYKANLDFNRSLDTLAHYGVPGMKWGVRNQDTLRKYNLGLFRKGATSRARRRLNIVKRFRSKMNVWGKKRNNLKQTEKKASPAMEALAEAKESGGYKIKEKNPKSLSDSDLQKANQRMQAEILYKRNQAQLAELNMTKTQKRFRNLKTNAMDVGGTVLKNFAKTQLTKALNSSVGSSKAADAAKKVKDQTAKATEKTKEKIMDSVNNVTYNTQINNFYTPTKGKDRPINVSSTIATVKDSSALPSGKDDKKKSSK